MRTTHKCDQVRKFLHISTTEDHPLRSELHMEQVGSVTYDLKSELHMHQMGSVMDDHPLKSELHMHQVGSVMDDHSLKSDLHMHKLGSVMDGRERKKKNPSGKYKGLRKSTWVQTGWSLLVVTPHQGTHWTE